MAKNSKNTRVSNNTGRTNQSNRPRPNTPTAGVLKTRRRYENGGKKCK